MNPRRLCLTRVFAVLACVLAMTFIIGSLSGRAQAQVCGDPPIDNDGDGLADCTDQCVQLPTEQCLSLPFFITVKTSSGPGQVACTFDGATIQCDEVNGIAVVSPVTAQSECRSAHRPPGWERPRRYLVDLGGGVRGWSDGTLAASCRAYRVGGGGYQYQGFTGDGVYRIDPDGPGGDAPFNVWCDMVFDGGGWTRVFFEDTAAGFFAVNEFEKNTANPLALRYAILNDLESFRRDGAFELKMNWPDDTTWTGYQHWSQTSNPVTDTPGAIPTGVVAHHVAYTSNVDSGNPNAWYGLQRSVNSGYSLLDGSINPNSNWFYAIGTAGAFWGGPAPKWQPGPGLPGSQKVALWVR